MFKPTGVSLMKYSATFSKFPFYSSRSKRNKSLPSSSMSMALLSACPVRVIEEHKDNELAAMEQKLLPTTPDEADVSNLESEDSLCDSSNSTSTTQSNDEENIDEGKVAQYKPFSYYPDNGAFNAALQLYNLQKAVAGGDSDNVVMRWESKGVIKASFQLCILCKDIGKPRSYREEYYLEVNEIRKYRTILCKGCLSYVLYKQVGSSLSDIQEKIKEITGVSDDVFKEVGEMNNVRHALKDIKSTLF